MKIAQVAPLYESVPPKLYGGTERVVSYLTEELVRMGHEVTLFASGDSQTAARLIPSCPRSLRLDTDCVDHLAHHFVMLGDVKENARRFDVIHFHIDYLHFPLSQALQIPSLTTLHGRLDIPELLPLYRKYREPRLVSISKAQRKPLSWANWVGNVYHGLPANQLHLHREPGKYLAFLGRISPEKRVDRAIKIALQAGMPLKIAAKIDRVDRPYYETEIKPLLNNPNIELIGEIGEQQKDDFLGNAYAYLFPIDWPEPFGLTMIEAMACGTPTIAFPCGSVREILDDHVTGFIVRNTEEAVDAVERVEHFDRARCRQAFEKRFVASRMAQDYLRLYETVIATPSGLASSAIQSLATR
ncbi:MAG TPA: glycosyltransferase family 4 protein [Candidatus Dormibacteraeota bacterium]|nr:glycosyltransferase family 4 protein [Candidatus Dormibacteraeota bacterium]